MKNYLDCVHEGSIERDKDSQTLQDIINGKLCPLSPYFFSSLDGGADDALTEWRSSCNSVELYVAPIESHAILRPKMCLGLHGTVPPPRGSRQSR
jgi:hypothetical protein